jgi:hypothetical protein
MAALPDY